MDTALVINLWDDYAEDESGQAQATHAYVEEDISQDASKQTLEGFVKAFKEWAADQAPTVTTELVWHEPLKIYPHMAGSDIEGMFQPSWRVNLVGLSHDARERFVDHMEALGPTLTPPLQVISES